MNNNSELFEMKSTYILKKSDIVFGRWNANPFQFKFIPVEPCKVTFISKYKILRECRYGYDICWDIEQMEGCNEFRRMTLDNRLRRFNLIDDPEVDKSIVDYRFTIDVPNTNELNIGISTSDLESEAMLLELTIITEALA